MRTHLLNSCIMSLFSMIGQLGSAGINYAAIQETNDSNLKIARETNDTNISLARERNQMEIAESEKAYQRSTAKNQIAELIKTGISEQQARQIVAGNGNPAAYQPAPLESTTAVAPTMQPPQIPANMFDGLGSELGSMFSGSFNQPDGGALGNLIASDANTFVSNHISDFDHHALSGFDAFVEFCSQSDNPVLKEFINGKDFGRIKSNYLARRAFISHIQGAYDSGNLEWQNEKWRFDALTSRYESQIREQLSIQEQGNTPVIQLQQHWDMKSIPQVALEQITRSMTELQKLRLLHEQQGTSAFKIAYKQYILNDIEEKATAAAALQAHDKLIREGYDSLSATERAAIQKLGLLNDMGITNEWLLGILSGKQIFDDLIDSSKGALKDFSKPDNIGTVVGRNFDQNPEPQILLDTFVSKYKSKRK